MMNRFFRSYQKKIAGVLSGLDRIVIAGAAANGKVVPFHEASKSQIAGE